MIDEIGVLGFYYNKGKVIDLLGLINPHAVTYLQKKNYMGILNYYKPGYLIVDYPKRPEYENFIETRGFLNSYSPAVIISGKGKSVEIYHSNETKIIMN